MILVCSHADADESKDRLAGFDEYAQTALTDWKTPGIAVVVIPEKKILLIKGYGVRQFGKPDLVSDRGFLAQPPKKGNKVTPTTA